MDWTDFAHDDQATLVLSLVTGHGRAAPLVWLRPSRTWGVLRPPLAVVGRGHDAVADHAGTGRA
jgi:hypothetical protein